MGEIALPDFGLKLDPEAHVYTLNGLAMPSVTTIMKPMSMMLYDGVPLQAMSEAADRGTRAHEQISNSVLYGVIETDDDTKPYIDAFKLFDDMYSPKWLASEMMVYHLTLRYAGTIDLLAYITPDDDTGIDVIDLKTTASFHRVMLSTQVSAYAEALKSHGIPVRNRYGLQLLKNGSFRFEKLEDNFKTFLHALALVNAMADEKN